MADMVLLRKEHSQNTGIGVGALAETTAGVGSPVASDGRMIVLTSVTAVSRRVNAGPRTLLL